MNTSRLDFGTIFSSTFQLYFDHWQKLVTISAIVMGVFALAIAAMYTVIVSSLGLLALVVIPLTFGILIIGSFLLQGVFVLAISDIQTGAPDRSVGDLFNAAMPRFGALFGTSLLAGLAIIGGLILCIIPGVAFSVLWALIIPIVMLEQLSGTDAMRRSWNLVKGEFWTVLGLVVVIGIIVAIVNSILGAILNVILPGVFLSQLAQQLPSIVTAPVSAVLGVLMYFALTTNPGGPEQQIVQPDPYGQNPPPPAQY